MNCVRVPIVSSSSVVLVLGFLLWPSVCDASTDPNVVARNFLTLLGYGDFQVPAPVEMPQDPDYAPILSFTSEGEYSMYLERDVGTIFIFSCGKFSGRDEIPPEERLSESQAFVQALPLLSFYGLSQEQSQYSIEFVTTAGCVWEIKKTFEFEGVPMYMRGLTVTLTGDTGKIIFVSYRPPVTPPAVASPITKEQALESAGTWLSTEYRYRDSNPRPTSDVTEITPVIVSGYRHFVDKRYDQEVAKNGEYCWRVPFQVTDEDGHEFVRSIWIRMVDGTVFDAY